MERALLKLWLPAAVIALFAGVLVLLFWRVGAFKSVEISVQGPITATLVYKEHLGAYDKIVPSLEAVETWAKREQLLCQETFGEFLDDPEKTESERLRANVGCWLPAGITDAHASGFCEEWAKKLAQQKFLCRSLTIARALVGEFSGAPSIGPFRVYPKAYKYLNDHKLPRPNSVFEIYQPSQEDGFTTRFVFSLPDS